MKRVTRSQDKWSEKGAKKSRTSVKDNQLRISCDYCQKDITHTTRILCAICTEFDLCLECFSGGVELKGHKFWHDYRIIEDLRFPFLDDWTVAEEQLLLEGLELFGIRNWTHIADYVGTKDVDQCRAHHEEFYLNSPSWPLISFDHILDTRLESGSSNKRSKCPHQARKERRAAMRSQRSTKKPVNVPSNPVHPDLSGYMPKRNEFECEWDDACEKTVMNIEFTDQDTPEEFEEKMQALEKYNQRLAKRHAMRKFATEKRLHDSTFQVEIRKARTPREELIHEDYKKYIQLVPPQEYEEFIKGLARQQELEEKVRELQQYRSAGVTSLKDGPDYKKHLNLKDQQKKTKSRSSSSSSSSTSWSASPPPSPSACPLPPISVTEDCDYVYPFSSTDMAPRFYFEEPAPSCPLTRSRTKTRPLAAEHQQVPSDQLQKRRTSEQRHTTLRRSLTGLEGNPTFRAQRTSSLSGPGTGGFLRVADNFVAVI